MNFQLLSVAHDIKPKEIIGKVRVSDVGTFYCKDMFKFAMPLEVSLSGPYQSFCQNAPNFNFIKIEVIRGNKIPLLIAGNCVHENLVEFCELLKRCKFPAVTIVKSLVFVRALQTVIETGKVMSMVLILPTLERGDFLEPISFVHLYDAQFGAMKYAPIVGSSSSKKRQPSSSPRGVPAPTRARKDTSSVRARKDTSSVVQCATNVDSSDSDDFSTLRVRETTETFLAIEDKRPLTMTLLDPDMVTSMGGCEELQRQWSLFVGTSFEFIRTMAEQYSQLAKLITSTHIANFQRDEAKAKAEAAAMAKIHADAEAKAKASAAAAAAAAAEAAAVLTNRKHLAEAEAAEDAKKNAEAAAEAAAVLTNRKLLAEAEAAEEEKANSKMSAEFKAKTKVEAAIAEQRRLDEKSAAEVAVLVQGVARDDRESLHRHQLENNAALAVSAAASVAALVPPSPTQSQYPHGESITTLDQVTRFSNYASTTEHAELLVTKCTANGCHAWCSGFAPHFDAAGLPVCGFHDVNKIAYRWPSGMTKTRRVLWMMYNGVSASGPCWLCFKEVHFPNFQASHIKPKCAVKDNSVGNLRVCCANCNNNCNSKNLRTFAEEQDLQAVRSAVSRKAADMLMATEYEAAELMKRFTSKKLDRIHHRFPVKLHSQLKSAEAKFAAAACSVSTASSSSSSASASISSVPSYEKLHSIFVSK